MGMQNRRGVYNEFDPQKMVPGEWAVVISGDEHAIDGKAVYMCFAAGDVKRMATYEDMLDYLTTVIEDANEIIVADMVEKTALADTAAGKANTAATIANTATSNANTAYQNYLENNAASSDKLKYPRTINGIDFDGTKDTTMYALCETAANTVEKTVTIDGFRPKEGSMLVVRFANGNTAQNPTLNVNGTGGQFILNRGFAPGANEIKKSQDHLLVYNGSHWHIVGDVDADSGWINATLSSKFEKYSDSSVVRYRKIGNRVTIEGSVKPKTEIAGSPTATAIFNLPAGYRPPVTRGCISQGSMVNNWFLTVQPDGTVGAARYGTTAVSAIPTTANLSFYFEFLVD